jgi:hypothetical protein
VKKTGLFVQESPQKGIPVLKWKKIIPMEEDRSNGRRPFQMDT